VEYCHNVWCEKKPELCMWLAGSEKFYDIFSRSDIRQNTGM